MVNKWEKVVTSWNLQGKQVKNLDNLYKCNDKQIAMDKSTDLDIVSEIINLETRITSAIIKGHKPSYDDEFQEDRDRLKYLRCLYFGNDSEYCKSKEW